MNIKENFSIDTNEMEYKIIDFKKIIGEHLKEVEYIKEISNGLMVSGGNDNKLFIYEHSSNKKIEIKDFGDWPSNICEVINKEKNDTNIQLIVCCKNELYFILFDFQNIKFDIKKKELNNISADICLEINENNYLISGETGAFIIKNLKYNSEIYKIEKILNQPYNRGIKINNNIIVLTSNKFLVNGEDKLIFYNLDTKKILKSINNYSFITNANGLSLMHINENCKILLCACKKYFDEQKNGILLVNPQLEDSQEIINPFYDTGDFEVFCFCQILIFDNEYSNKNSKGKYSNFFFVGGFDKEKGEGIIKLYKLIYNEKISDTKIEFFLEIENEYSDNFTGFEGPVSCISQSNINGNIFITSWDGKVYLFNTPNINFYLNSKNLYFIN